MSTFTQKSKLAQRCNELHEELQWANLEDVRLEDLEGLEKALTQVHETIRERRDEAKRAGREED